MQDRTAVFHHRIAIGIDEIVIVCNEEGKSGIVTEDPNSELVSAVLFLALSKQSANLVQDPFSANSRPLVPFCQLLFDESCLNRWASRIREVDLKVTVCIRCSLY